MSEDKGYCEAKYKEDFAKPGGLGSAWKKQDHIKSKEDCAKADKQDQTRDYRWVEPKKD